MADPSVTEKCGDATFTYNPLKYELLEDPDRPGKCKLVKAKDIHKGTCGGEPFEYDKKTHVLIANPSDPTKCLVVKKIVRDPGILEPPNI